MTSASGVVVVTRDESPNGPLCSALRASGLIPLLRPVLETVPLLGESGVGELRTRARDADWLLFTSPRTVRILERLGFFEGSPPSGLRIGATGPSTAASLAEVGWTAHVVPAKAGAQALLDDLKGSLGAAGSSPTVLIPGSERSRPELPEGLEALGCTVVSTPVYDVVANEGHARWWGALSPDRPLALSFCSPSAVEAAEQLIVQVEADALKGSLLVGAQGPTTSSAALDAGWRNVVEATPRTFSGLVDSLVRAQEHAQSESRA